MTSQELTDQLAHSGEHEFVERLNAVALAKTSGGLIKNTDPEVRWKTMRLNVADVNDQGIIDGMASGYLNLDSDDEVCLPGCFDRSLSEGHNPHPVVLWQHNTSLPIGFHVGPGSGDATKGLPIQAELMLDCEPGRYALAFAKAAKRHGAKAGISVGFRIVKDALVDGSNVRGGTRGKQYRGFEQCSLLEYSLVTFPANSEAFVTDVKSQFDEAIRKTTYSIPLIETKAEILTPPVAPANGRKEAAMAATTDTKETTTLLTFQSALAQQAQEEQAREQRWDLESALADVIDSIKNSNLDPADMKMALSDAYSAYSAAIVAWHMSNLNLAKSAVAGIKAIKGMTTQQHVDMQANLSKAKVHMDEAKAQRGAADMHSNKAHRYMSEALTAYSAADIQLPNGTASAKKDNDNEAELKTKAAKEEEEQYRAMLLSLADALKA